MLDTDKAIKAENLPGEGGCELHLELWSLRLSELPAMEILTGCQCPTGEEDNMT